MRPYGWGVALLLLVSCAAPSSPPPVPAPVVTPTVAAPVASSAPQAAYASWASAAARRTGIPARALKSYAVAEAKLARLEPSCSLGWVTLAGIGAVESDHARHGSRSLLADGRSSRPIIGLRLDGSPGVKRIRDSDDGALDGDSRFDRAVGPLQFIPSTWKRWATDGDGDGVADPHDLDDAAVSAGRYLCATGGDLDTATGWSTAVLSYNDTENYLRDVHAHAQTYADRGGDL